MTQQVLLLGVDMDLSPATQAMLSMVVARRSQRQQRRSCIWPTKGCSSASRSRGAGGVSTIEQGTREGGRRN